MAQSITNDSSIALGSPWQSKIVQSSTTLEQSDIVIERHVASPEERPANTMELHVISVLTNASSKFERKDRLGHWVNYVKTSDAITLTPAGSVAEFCLRSPAELIHVGLHRSLIDRTAEEMEEFPRGELSERIGVRDRAMANIVSLLNQELESGTQSRRLYVESLASALAVRYLVTAHQKPFSHSRVRPLPGRMFERVREKMQENLSRDLSLNSLAREAGYSSAHFLRMFHASTGSTPHHFLLELRLQRAKQLLMHDHQLSIVIIAGMCGFSTQSHFTSMFRQKLGVTPAEFRRTHSRR